ncbi:uncharacterized protein FFE2_16048 [Fusarium fujikuroi]|nr:uncharacterized protein FFE2_16048 [Fusarium fujikuroi]SCV30714.1 uncharacterized protein FFFS_02421 [Fusarium fujikuroi]
MAIQEYLLIAIYIL